EADLLKSAGADLRKPDVATIVFALAIFGPVAGILAHLLLSTLYVAFRSTGFQDDADREWLARVGAVVVFPALLWTIFALICLFLPFVFIDNSWLRDLLPAWGSTVEGWAKALGAISGVISGFVAVLGGKSAVVRLDISNTAPKSGS